MARICSICGHSEREEIDRLLLSGASYRDIAGRFGTSKSSLERHHKSGHISEAIAKAQGAKEVTNADNLLDQILYYEAEARRFKGLAEADGDVDLALKAVDRALKCVEIYAKVRGIINDAPQITIIDNPQWIELRTVIIQALDDFPEAKAAVVHAIHK